MSNVLLIDDDVELMGMLKEYLEQEGFSITVAYDGEAGSQLALTRPFDIVVLDVMMPKLNGIDTLRKIRATSKLPVIMLTAKGDDDNRILGLELGADDYVPKPSTPRELVARIRAILRRTQVSAGGPDVLQIAVGSLSLWPEQRRVEWAGHTLDLTSTEFNLLEVLVRNAGHVVSKEDLSLQGLGRPLARFDRSIDVHLSSIRQKLNQLSEGNQCIQTVYRMGYQLIKEPVNTELATKEADAKRAAGKANAGTKTAGNESISNEAISNEAVSNEAVSKALPSQNSISKDVH